jgi:hypothetical protein
MGVHVNNEREFPVFSLGVKESAYGPSSRVAGAPFLLDLAEAVELSTLTNALTCRNTANTKYLGATFSFYTGRKGHLVIALLGFTSGVVKNLFSTFHASGRSARVPGAQAAHPCGPMPPA